MQEPIVAPFGSWKSPLSAQRIAAGSKSLAAPRFDGGDVVWLEGLAAEGGRVAAVRRRAGTQAGAVVTPAPFNVRSRVHEYGGGALLADRGTLYFSNFADNLVYAQGPRGVPRALTADAAQRHADFEIDRSRRRLIAVREDPLSLAANSRKTCRPFSGWGLMNRMVNAARGAGGKCAVR